MLAPTALGLQMTTSLEAIKSLSTRKTAIWFYFYKSMAQVQMASGLPTTTGFYIKPNTTLSINPHLYLQQMLISGYSANLETRKIRQQPPTFSPTSPSPSSLLLPALCSD